ncbi:hypothetical protein Psuf_091360 [Phytohabitans suffuscus]|uniref:Uncharacterized protein n=1 Tax=Phytohabitans suffuscus TaxID=624315 RepID=A0A6F8Z0P8_9ACTN|nr:hypothetical protein Psuf_091360 [Phytohabitans suffuscus]
MREHLKLRASNLIIVAQEMSPIYLNFVDLRIRQFTMFEGEVVKCRAASTDIGQNQALPSPIHDTSAGHNGSPLFDPYIDNVYYGWSTARAVAGPAKCLHPYVDADERLHEH